MYCVPHVTDMSSFSGVEETGGGSETSAWTELLGRASVQMKPVPTWSSVGGADNAGVGYLSPRFKDESEVPQKEQQPHCFECGAAREQTDTL